MRLARVHIQSFRCLSELNFSFDDVTVLVGANSTGKSTVLHALEWFFEGGDLELHDLAGHQADSMVSVGATFSDFTSADGEALGSYVVGDEATFWRTWSIADGEKLTGRGRAYPAFEEVRQHQKALEKRKAYSDLRSAHPDLDLPTANSAQAVDNAMEAWEQAHPDDLEESRVSATHLFGFTGGSRLNGRFDFVLVPAVSDPGAEIRDARGTLLRQLLDRAMGDQTQMKQRLSQLEASVVEQMQTIIEAEGGEALKRLSASVTEELARLVPAGQVVLDAEPPPFRVPELNVGLRIAEGGLETDISRQGHGFQRALLIAVVQQLASMRPSENDGETHLGEPPALFLALEEPELYQHPLQARHFAATLADVARDGRGPIQVAYATHSEHFVDPARYERLRRFRRRAATVFPQGEVTQATIAGVTQRLADVVPAEQVETRIRVTLRRQLAEAVFARAVVLVEGYTDAGFLHGLADRDGGFDADGIAVVSGFGKTNLLIPWAILAELGIPTFLIFDGDRERANHLRAAGNDADADAADAAVARENRTLLTALSQPPVAHPPTTVGSNYAVFEDTLEAEAARWDGYEASLETCKENLADWRGKSEDAYRQAANSVTAPPPPVFVELVAAVRALL